jgi:general secretion pathway protein D
MEINETIDEISGSIAIANVGNVPTTTSRQISAEVAVRDGESIVLGGFVRNSDNKSSSGVPILKDIPILGALFESKSDAKQREELLVLMEPKVLRTPDIAALEAADERNHLPGIRNAEAEMRRDEKKAIQAQEKEERHWKSVDDKEKAKLEAAPDTSSP